MKQSLKKALELFPFFQRITLYWILLRRRMNWFVRKESYLFDRCMQYVDLIERGVELSNASSGLLELKYPVNDKPLRFLVRPDGSDIKVFVSVVLDEEYKAAKDVLRLRQTPITIIDAGGNIGFTMLYFFAFLPGASFIVVEPDANNFRLLQQNTEINEVQHVSLLQRALWINEDELELDDSFRDGQEWSLSVKAKQPNGVASHHNVRGISLAVLCEMAGHPVDLVKIDIEGAERFLFNHNAFLDTIGERVQNMVIELHDEYPVRPVVYAEMGRMQFSLSEHGDVTLFTKSLH